MTATAIQENIAIDKLCLSIGGSAILIAIILWFDNAQGGIFS